MSREQASIGSAQYYGPRVANEGLDSSVNKSGIKREREVFFDFAQANAGLPTENADTDAGTLVIPANSIITSAYLEVNAAFTATGAATLSLGVQLTDGTASSAVGLDTLAKAVLTAKSWHVLDGALIGATVGVADVQISIDDATDVFLTGTARLIVEYIEPQA